MSELNQYSILDFADIQNHKRVPLSSMERVKRKGRFPYYGASGIIDYVNDFLFDGEYVLISEDGENLKSRNTPVAFEARGQFWVNNHAHIVKGKKDFHNKLLVYYFQYLDLNPYLTGAVQPKLNKEQLISIPIILPENETIQKTIVEILSSLDNKIDLLYHQNKNLEQLAETLFRQWFVEEAKYDWEDAMLSDIASHYKQNIIPSKNPETIYYHYSLPAFDEGKEPKSELGKDILSNKYQVISDSILISKLNPKTPRIWGLFGSIEETNAICSTEFQVIKPKQIVWLSFIYCFLKSYQVVQELTGASSGTSGSHQRVTPDDIFNLKFSKPPQSKVDKFNFSTKELFEKVKINAKQIRTLIQLRDALLPKLMSGEVRISLTNG